MVPGSGFAVIHTAAYSDNSTACSILAAQVIVTVDMHYYSEVLHCTDYTTL